MSVKNLTFDLSKILKNAEPDRRKRIALLPFTKLNEVKVTFGNRIIEAIVQRTLSGKDKNDVSFKPYSKAYRDSTEFKIFKGSKRTPDLKLSGEMLAAIDILKTGRSTVTIGFASASGKQEDKAQGHIEGGGNLPVRDFWGIDDKDALKIMKEIIRDINKDAFFPGAALLQDLFITEPISATTVIGEIVQADDILFIDDIGGNNGFEPTTI